MEMFTTLYVLFIFLNFSSWIYYGLWLQFISYKMVIIACDQNIYTVSQKTIPDIFSCNLNKLCVILIFFARALLRHWAMKSWFIFPPHLISVSALPAEIK